MARLALTPEQASAFALMLGMPVPPPTVRAPVEITIIEVRHLQAVLARAQWLIEREAGQRDGH